MKIRPTHLQDSSRTRQRLVVLTAILVGLFAAALLMGLSVGTVWISPADVFRSVLRLPLAEGDAWKSEVIWSSRLPRTLLALFGGSVLASSGVALQGLFRNPLADPSLLGISSGATLGAVGTLYLLPSSAPFGPLVAAFAFALLAAGGATVLSNRLLAGTYGLVLAGLALSSFFNACTSFALVLSVAEWELGKQMLSWMMGGLEGRSFVHVALLAPAAIYCLWAVFSERHALDALSFGDEHAFSLGIDVARSRRRLLLATSLGTAACVAVMGTVAFLGLIAPHVARSMVSGKHARLVPASFLVGGIGLCACDLVSRAVASRFDLRPSVLLGLIGGGFFLLQLGRRRV